jgi:hypothetical protein
VRWFTNHSPHRTASQRPRATNGANISAQEHKAEITERMAEQQSQEGGIPKQDKYDQLNDEGRCAYETKAAKKNEALPETSEIFT